MASKSTKTSTVGKNLSSTLSSTSKAVSSLSGKTLTSAQKNTLSQVSATLGNIKSGLSSLSAKEKKSGGSGSDFLNTPSSMPNINPESLAPVDQKISLPQPETPLNYNSILTGANAGLANPMASSGYTLGENGQFIQNPTEVAQPVQSQMDKMREIIGEYQEPESQAKIYNKALKESGVREKQQVVSSYTNQLNSIVAKSQADQLSVTGQGRGIPEVIIGGQQSRIAKEAAIQALPVQAQLAAAQGDLAMAESHLDTLFKLRLADAEAKTNYHNKIVDLNYDLFNKEEQRRLDDIRFERSENSSTNKDAVDFAQSLAGDALRSGNNSVANAIMSIPIPDSSSKTYQQDIADYYKQISKYTVSNTPINNNPSNPNNGDPKLFTQTQLNKGASVAGVPMDVFSTYDKDSKNYFINTTTKALQDSIQKTITAPLTDRTKTAEEIKSEIESSNLAPGVKEYLKSKVDEIDKTVDKEGWFDKVKEFFGF